MKQRKFFVPMILIFAVSFVSAQSLDSQKIFPVGSPVYEALAYLYISQGYALPSTAAPYSGDELSLMLSRLAKEKLDVNELKTYQFAEDQLSKKLPSFSVGAKLSLEAYIHTDTIDFADDDQWYYSYEKRAPLLSVPVEISLANNFYGYIGLQLSETKYTGSLGAVTGLSDQYGTYVITTNGYNFWQDEELTLDANIPYRAFSAIGGQGWSLELGRDQLSWGPGTTGNFLLGDQVQYHNQGRFTAYSPSFKYTFATSFFPSPDEIWNTGNPYSQARPLLGLKMFMAHRFEWRLFGDTVGLALNEGIMYQPENGVLDPRVLNPFMLYHNYFIRSDANSIASLELDYTPFGFWNIYSQLVVDEIAFGSVEQNLPVEKRHPNGIGLMLGIRTVRPVSGGMFYANLEGVYTDPYLYLRSKDGDATQSETDPSDSLNFVVAIRRWFSDRIVYDQTFLGYRYGGDALVGNLVTGFKKYRDWSVDGRIFYMIHGENNASTPWKLGELSLAPSGDCSQFLDIGVSGSKVFLDVWKVYGGLDVITTYTSSTLCQDVQLNLGVSYSIL